MPYLFKNEYFLEDLFLREFILHVVFINGLNRDILPCEFMHTKGDLTKSAFSNEFHKLVEIKRRRWDLLVLLDICPIVFNELVSFLHELLVQLKVNALTILG